MKVSTLSLVAAALLALSDCPETWGSLGWRGRAPVTIDEMVVAGVTMTNVDAVVAQGLSTNLLGQSVLGKLGSVNLQGDQMVIRPR
mgnify:CR=1 FL=1